MSRLLCYFLFSCLFICGFDTDYSLRTPDCRQRRCPVVIYLLHNSLNDETTASWFLASNYPPILPACLCSGRQAAVTGLVLRPLAASAQRPRRPRHRRLSAPWSGRPTCTRSPTSRWSSSSLSSSWCTFLLERRSCATIWRVFFFRFNFVSSHHNSLLTLAELFFCRHQMCSFFV